MSSAPLPTAPLRSMPPTPFFPFPLAVEAAPAPAPAPARAAAAAAAAACTAAAASPSFSSSPLPSVAGRAINRHTPPFSPTFLESRHRAAATAAAVAARRRPAIGDGVVVVGGAVKATNAAATGGAEGSSAAGAIPSSIATSSSSGVAAARSSLPLPLLLLLPPRGGGGSSGCSCGGRAAIVCVGALFCGGVWGLMISRSEFSVQSESGRLVETRGLNAAVDQCESRSFNACRCLCVLECVSEKSTRGPLQASTTRQQQRGVSDLEIG
jgi:hypothetical protein